MILEGSCHCGAVSFSVEAYAPAPFAHCYCSICRKTAGAGGSAVNLGAWADSLKVDGEWYLSVYRARLENGEKSPAKRHFCSRCGSPLWVFDPRWPELVHPHASAVDTPLPEPPERVHLMLGSKASWVSVPEGEGHRHFDELPDESLEEWHRRHGLLDERNR